MSPDRRNREATLRIGEMPNPRYIVDAADTTADGKIKWIGMESYAPNGELGKFLWWENFKVGNLNNERARYRAAALIARLKLATGIDTAIGLPIDIEKSDSQTGHVQILDYPGVYGVYVEARRRPGFNVMTMMGGVRTEGQFRRSDPVKFDKVFQNARKMLPKTSK